MTIIPPPTSIKSVALAALRAYLEEKTGIEWNGGGSPGYGEYTGTISFFTSGTPEGFDFDIMRPKVYLSLEYTGLPSDEPLMLDWDEQLQSIFAELSHNGESAVWDGKAVQLFQGIKPSTSGQWQTFQKTERPSDSGSEGAIAEFKLQHIYEYVQPTNLLFSY